MNISPYVYPDLANQERFKVLNGKLCYDTGLLLFIETLVTSYFGETIDGMKVRSRLRNKVLCRHVCFYFMRKKTGLTYKEIGERFFLHEHTSVLHGVNAVKDLMFSDESIRTAVQLLEAKIDERK